MKISIYGIGNFGFAILKHLSDKYKTDPNIKIYAYDRDKKLILHLQKTGKHLRLYKNFSLSKNINFTKYPKEIFQNSHLIIMAVSSNALIKILRKNKKYIDKSSIILNTAKALDYQSGLSFSQIIKNIPKVNKCRFAVFSGGTIAADLLKKEPLGADIACKNRASLKELKQIFTSNNLNIYTTTDILGVEYAGAFKNVISILAGIINGLGFSYGSETHFITRAAKEITSLIKKKIKASHYTFSLYSQCWGNDLWMSCTGNTRNRKFGILIGKGLRPKQALFKMAALNKNVEGIHTVRALKKLNINSHYPILKGIWNIVIQNRNPRTVICQLMSSNNI